MKSIYRKYFATKFDITITTILAVFWSVWLWFDNKAVSDKLGSIATFLFMVYVLFPVMFHYSDKFIKFAGRKLKAYRAAKNAKG